MGQTLYSGVYNFSALINNKNCLKKEMLLKSIGKQIATNMPNTFNKCWCFFAGFAFILHGVERETNDIDILVKNSKSRDKIVKVIKDLNFIEKGTSYNITNYINQKLDVSIDIILNQVLFTTPESFWDNLYFVKYNGADLPTPSKLDMILLKVIIYNGRAKSDIKRQNDLFDVNSLIKKDLNIKFEDIVEYAKKYDLQLKTQEFLLLIRNLTS